MNSNNPYNTPKSALSELESTVKTDTIFKKFLYGFFITVIIFILIVILTIPKQEWVLGSLGGVIFGVLSGFISALFPSKKRVIYISVGVIVSIVVAYFIGVEST